ncbi:hypothetical protein PABG_07617 [Paracoccidioides brasiliensis Pb03]|nr:hypothetical protein PABG_07617 [Paracoccidioides brasiliensis Pb03]
MSPNGTVTSIPPSIPSVVSASAVYMDLVLVLVLGTLRRDRVVGQVDFSSTFFVVVISVFRQQHAQADGSLVRDHAQAIQHVGFNGDQIQSAAGYDRGSYLSARYERRWEDTDFTDECPLMREEALEVGVRARPLEDAIIGCSESKSKRHFNKTIQDLQLDDLLDLPVSNLSSGQSRRKRIAKALLMKPEVLFLDDPFMGLDRSIVPSLSCLLYQTTLRGGPRMVQNQIPGWVSKVEIGPKKLMVIRKGRGYSSWTEMVIVWPKWHGKVDPHLLDHFGPSADIFAAYQIIWPPSFARTCLDVDSVLRLFEANLNPDFIPWADFLNSNTETNTPKVVPSTKWANFLEFSSLSVAQQRVILFLQALIHRPDLIILDEAFSGMESFLRDKCFHFLEMGKQLAQSSGSRRKLNYADVWHRPKSIADSKSQLARYTGIADHQALVVISHIKEEVPDIVSHWMRPPTPASTATGPVTPNELALVMNFKVGQLKAQEAVAVHAWENIWKPN